MGHAIRFAVDWLFLSKRARIRVLCSGGTYGWPLVHWDMTWVRMSLLHILVMMMQMIEKSLMCC